MMTYIAMVVEGRSWPFTQRKIKRDYPALQINGWKVRLCMFFTLLPPNNQRHSQLWPLASLINYKFVPLQFRVLFANIVSVFWCERMIPYTPSHQHPHRSTFLILRARSSSHMVYRLPSKAA